MILAGPVIVFAVAANADFNRDEPLLSVGIGMVPIGAVLGIFGLAGMEIYDEHEEDGRKDEVRRPPSSPGRPSRPAAPEPDEATKRQRAELLMHAARTFAQANDCERVVEYSRAVVILDPEFHATVFMHDAWIRPCLAPPAPAIESSPVPQE